MERKSITLGVYDLVEICAQIEICTIVPYAHGHLNRLDQERRRTKELSILLEKRSIQTEVLNWSFGEKIRL